MKTEIIRQFVIKFECDEAQAKVISEALHKVYREVKDECGYTNPKATILREARNAFSDATGVHYIGEDA